MQSSRYFTAGKKTDKKEIIMKQTMSWIIAVGLGVCVSTGCSKENDEQKNKAPEAAQVELKARTPEITPETQIEETAEAAAKAVAESATEIKTDIQKGAEKIQEAAAATTAKQEKPAVPEGITLEEYWAGLTIPEVVANIDGKNITKEDLLKEIKSQIPPAMQGKKMPPQLFAQLSGQLPSIVDIMISRKILLSLAEAAGIKPSKKELEARIDKFINDMPADQKRMFEAQLKAQGSSLEKYREEAVSQIASQEAAAIDKWITDKIIPTLKVDDEAANKYYREHQDNFKKPATIKVAHILIVPERASIEKLQKMSAEERAAFTKNADEKAKAKAEEILKELKNGANFAELAEKNSACPSKKEGGVLPAFDAKGTIVGGQGGAMVKPFTEASFKLKDGELSQPVKTQFGYHIIKALEHQKESYIPFDSVKGYLKETIQNKELAKKMKEMIDSEKEKRNVKILIKPQTKTASEAAK